MNRGSLQRNRSHKRGENQLLGVGRVREFLREASPWPTIAQDMGCPNPNLNNATGDHGRDKCVCVCVSNKNGGCFVSFRLPSRPTRVAAPRTGKSGRCLQFRQVGRVRPRLLQLIESQAGWGHSFGPFRGGALLSTKMEPGFSSFSANKNPPDGFHVGQRVSKSESGGFPSPTLSG